MKLAKETEQLIEKAVKNWNKIQEKCFPIRDEYADMSTPIGDLHWQNKNLLWVFLTDNEEGYEGSQTQLGLNREGKIMWEYQSHCSCNGYETSHEHGAEFGATKKTYQLEEIPIDWESKVRENIEKLLAAV